MIVVGGVHGESLGRHMLVSDINSAPVPCPLNSGI